MRPFSILQTLWTTGAIRCVLVKQLEPPRYAVQVFNGARVVYTELVEHPEEAGEIAATLCGAFIVPTTQT
jgi:hypothetical protein